MSSQVEIIAVSHTEQQQSSLLDFRLLRSLCFTRGLTIDDKASASASAEAMVSDMHHKQDRFREENSQLTHSVSTASAFALQATYTRLEKLEESN
jgi:hypothetical protein